MKILCNLMKYDYGDEKRGLSFEYNTFYTFFKKQGHKTTLFDYMTMLKTHGKERMNQKLYDLVIKTSPDIIFSVAFKDEFDKPMFQKIKNIHGRSIVWMCDDKYRWERFGRHMCGLFNHTITTDPDALQKYSSMGYKNVILSQWGCNPYIFKKMRIKKDIDVSFVGQANAWRRYLVAKLRKKGINIECFGYGWDNGIISIEKMIEVFNRSKINLNISNSVHYDLEYLFTINLQLNRELNFLWKIYAIFGPQIEFLISRKRKEDIKARFFEVTGCGSFLLSYNVKYLDTYFKIGKEIACYTSIDDLYQKIFFYLNNTKEREKIAHEGYRRTINEHSYKKRFEYIFSQVNEN